MIRISTGTEITLIARIALHLSYSDLTTPTTERSTKAHAEVSHRSLTPRSERVWGFKLRGILIAYPIS
ncbi:unknown protein [Microcystis aeruginosa NIES-843]|uniref:Uncharacterized protein n=1 Tax=Microcystis aeruginosa (strain NIES-843 / IAM M-2473) TaxID=449447 RepID=B0JJE2_MICAN|nr:unknown protein [Microcystis aeruginosa NIES-843]